jgi:threonine dehydrogenase-like Zn-dependent dehydrogenase
MTQELAKLSERLATLERQNRRLRTGGLALVGVLGAVGLMSARSALCDQVSAERFVVRDTHGRTRMVMDAYSNEPVISLRNEAGKTVASMGIDEKGEAYLTFFDATGKARGSDAKCDASKCDKQDKQKEIAMR